MSLHQGGGIGKAHTRVENHRGTIRVWYHSCKVFEWDMISQILSLSHDGWVTQTTARRMNEALLTFNTCAGQRLADVAGLVIRRKGKLILQRPNGELTEIPRQGLTLDFSEWRDR